MKNLTIIIKTMDRYICLKPLLKSIIKKYPNIPILIGDDSRISCKKLVEKDFSQANITFYELPYDCGLSYGRNFLVSHVKTKYFCLCDDDFVFDAKTDLETAVNILEEKNVDILGGYIRNYKIVTSFKDRLIKLGQKLLHYELPTNYIGSMTLKKDVLYADYHIKDFPEFKYSDLVLNFFIAKTNVIKQHPWDDELKLQEHTAFFYQAKTAGLKVAFTNQLSVRHCPIQKKKYKDFRTRNYTHVFMEKNNINKVVATYDDKRGTIVTELPKIKDYLISVIVPCYNIENKADLLIKTLKEQTYKNFEVLLVDNNSTDKTIDYLKNLIKDDKRFRIIKEKRQGPNYARKKGYLSSKGEYIYFCDADDYLEDDTLYHFMVEISQNNSDLVIGNYIEHNNDNRKMMKGIFQDYKGNLVDYKDILFIKPAIWNKIFKKSLIDDNSFIFTFIGEDMLITLLSIIRSKKITYIDKVVYHYIASETGLSATVSYDKLINLIDTHKLILKTLIDNNYYDKYKEELDYIFLTHTIYRMFKIVTLKNKLDKNKAYVLLNDHLKSLDKTNKYLKKSFAYSIAYKIVSHKLLFSVCSPFIKLLFTNKTLNKLFRKMDH